MDVINYVCECCRLETINLPRMPEMPGIRHLTLDLHTAGNRLFKSTKNDYKNELNMFTCFGLFFEILNLLKIIYFNSDKM